MADPNTDQFADFLAGSSPAGVSDDLFARLNAALEEADQEVRGEDTSNVVQVSFRQWAMAAAALFVGLLMAVQSTRTSGDAGQVVEADAQPASPIYEVVDGRLLPVSDSNGMQMVRYRGVEIVDGRAFRQYLNNDKILLQPIFYKQNEQDAK